MIPSRTPSELRPRPLPDVQLADAARERGPVSDTRRSREATMGLVRAGDRHVRLVDGDRRIFLDRLCCRRIHNRVHAHQSLNLLTNPLVG
jgi:hypothetical protein